MYCRDARGSLSNTAMVSAMAVPLPWVSGILDPLGYMHIDMKKRSLFLLRLSHSIMTQIHLSITILTECLTATGCLT